MPEMLSRVSVLSSGSPLPADLPHRGTAERILVAALDRFAEQGFGATSIRDIAGDLGLNSATLYSHFASKEAILAELVLIGHQTHYSRLLKATLRSAGDPLSQLTACTKEHVLVHCEFPRLAVVANHELHALSPEAAGPALALRNQAVALFTDILERGQASGTWELEHVGATTAAIAGMGVHAARWFPDPRVDLGPEQLADHYATLIRRMVGVRE
jgi:AcrR family transcriptional regulator